MENNNDFFLQFADGGSVNYGSVMMQAKGSIGGHKHVFVMTSIAVRGGFNYPPIGGRIVNPFPYRAKVYAGDFCQYEDAVSNENGATIKILKSYEVAFDTSTEADTTISIVRNGYRHIPFVGDNLMVGQKDFATKGKAVTVTAVTETSKMVLDESVDVWEVELSAPLGSLSAGTVLVEAASSGEDVLPMVTNPNSYFTSDIDYAFASRSEASDYSRASYQITPAMASSDVYLYKHMMSPIPPALEALNTCRVEGWFAL